MPIYSSFDSGNIEVVSEKDCSFQLRIRKDTKAKYAQWFYFGLSDQKGKACRLEILDTKDTSYPEGWENARALVSVDREHWTRVPMQLEGDRLILEYTPTEDLAFFAYFFPYSYEDYLNWVSKIQLRCSTKLLTLSTEGRPLHLLQVGEASPYKKKCWFIARQHSGEAMASWFIEGLLSALLANHSNVLKDAVFYIVPLMNPDGVFHGNLRANAEGLDLNREWRDADAKRSPEVFYTREKMRELGVDFFMDVHGDETIPYVFLATAEDNLNHSEYQKTLEGLYVDALLKATPEFQTKYGYEKSHFSDSTPTLACNHVAEHFGCLSFTLEMPFQDNNNLPNAVYGWSPDRAKALSMSVLEALSSVLPYLK